MKAFLGLINYYGRFIPNLSSRLSPLYSLLRKNTKYVWNDDCNKVFEDSKKLLLKPNFLEFYDPDKPIVVVSDACGYGLGGVIAHVVGKEERPISFTSFSLNDAQKSYPILHLEALAVVSTIKKFHKFLYGKKFTVFTDHKPLIGIFGKDGKNSIFVTRLQRYILELSIYDFEIIYRPSTKMGNADYCSRFPLPQEVPRALQREYIKSINVSGDIPLDYRTIAKETQHDEFLQQILSFMKTGWPKKLSQRFKDIYSNHQDLEELDGCLIFQDRIAIPTKLQNSVLKLLHRNHSGITKFKQLARRSVYWFGINSDIESFVKHCRVCSQMAVVAKNSTQTSWIPTNRPFSRIHADFFYFQQKLFLVVVDSHSKWLEVDYMRYGTDATKVKSKFMAIFARFGLPDVIVTDGGPPFNSKYLIDFWSQQGIQVLKSPPYHPSSNGQAERMVRTVKEVLKKFLLDPELKGLDIEDQISYFLFNYRNICSEDNRFPSEKLLKFTPKTTLDLVNPKSSFKKHLTTHTCDDSLIVKNDKPAVPDKFSQLRHGEPIYFKNFRATEVKRWLDAKFLKRLSPNVFQVSVGGRIYSAHRDQLKLKPRPPKTLVCGWKPSRKRQREDDEEYSDDSNSSDFYGFLADSFINEPQQQQTVEVGSSLSIPSTSDNSLSIPSSSSNSLSKHVTGNSLSVDEMASSGSSLLPSSGVQMPMSANSCIPTSSREDGAFEVSSGEYRSSSHGSSVPVDHRKSVDHQKASISRNVVQPRRSRRTKRQKQNSEFYYY